MFAKGRQPLDFSPKEEFLKKNPSAVCKRRYYGASFGNLYALYKHKDDEKPMLIRPTAWQAWEDAYYGETH